MIDISNGKFTVRLDENGITQGFYTSACKNENLIKEKGPFAVIKMGGETLAPISAEAVGNVLKLDFDRKIIVVISAEIKGECIIFTVAECAPDVSELLFCSIEARETEKSDIAGMALTMFTKSSDMLGISGSLWAKGYNETGIIGCSFAIVVSDSGGLRDLMREVTKKYTVDIPYSKNGGAFAADNISNRYSYLLNTSGITPETADSWILKAKAFGAHQIDFHGGVTFRFGDMKLNEAMFPEGRKTFAAIIDKMHRAGLQAGLHTYAQFIDPYSEYVSPIPHKELAGELFTLSEDIDESAGNIPVNESTADVSAVTGFFIRNSVHLVIDEEIIKFAEVEENKFIKCTRGEFGTKISGHRKGAPVKHLYSAFGLFAADGDSELYLEIARKTAEMYNECGFDMIYLDAIDGSDIFRGTDMAWYYGARFVGEIIRNAVKPPLLEASAMWHHFWYFRSRLGAWDHPRRAHKALLQEHNKSNQKMRRKTLLPQNLGWWCYGRASITDSCQVKRMFIDDYEYYAQLALKNDWSLAFIVGEDPEKCEELKRIAGLIRTYEDLRLSNRVVSGIETGKAEYKLTTEGVLKPVSYSGAEIVMDDSRNDEICRGETSFNINTGEVQLFRIENLPAICTDSEKQLLICNTDFTNLRTLTSKNTRAEIKYKKGQHEAIEFSAVQEGDIGYARFEKKFNPGYSVGENMALGLWICGDGKGEKIDIQLKSPKHLIGGLCDRVIDIDFTGWRYITLLESDAKRLFENIWPFSGGGHYNEAEKLDIFDNDDAGQEPSQYEWQDSVSDAGLYHVVRENVDFNNLYSISVWLNNMKSGVEYSVLIGDIFALPIKKAAVKQLVVSVNGKPLSFMGRFTEDSYIEYDGGKWYAFDINGNSLADFILPESSPEFTCGNNIVDISVRKNDIPQRLALTIGITDL